MYSLKAENDVRTDIYSLCALLYFMLNKQKPMDVLKRFYYPELLYEKEIDELLKQIISKGLSIDKNERYSSCEELLEELEKVKLSVYNKIILKLKILILLFNVRFV